MMTLVITLFSIPIGILLFLNERKTHHLYDGVFHQFCDEVKADGRLNHQNKIAKLRAMLEKNHYDITIVDTHHISAEKKLFSVGLLSIGVGLFYIGAILYVIYFYRFQKPHVVKFEL